MAFMSFSSPSRQSSRLPERIVEFAEGSMDTPFSAARMNEIIRVLNAFLNLRAGDGVLVTRAGDGGLVISLRDNVPSPSDAPTPAPGPPAA